MLYLKKTCAEILYIKYCKNKGWVLRLYRPKEIVLMDNKELNILIYADNKAIIFNDRDSLISRSIITCKVVIK